MSKVRVTVELDLKTGDYDIQYNNLSQPGKPLDFTALMQFMHKVFVVHATDVIDDAEDGRTGQAKLDE